MSKGGITGMVLMFVMVCVAVTIAWRVTAIRNYVFPPTT